MGLLPKLNMRKHLFKRPLKGLLDFPSCSFFKGQDTPSHPEECDPLPPTDVAKMVSQPPIKEDTPAGSEPHWARSAQSPRRVLTQRAEVQGHFSGLNLQLL